MSTGFDDYYGLEQWSALDQITQRDWYVPELLFAFFQRSNLQQLIPTRVNFAAKRTKKMIWTGLFMLEPSWDPIATRSLWLDRMHPTGWQQEMELLTYGSGIGLHKYDDIVTFWEAGGGRAALRSMMRLYVADAIIQHHEMLALNAFLSKPTFYVSGGGNGFDDIGVSDTYDPDIALEVQLDFQYAELRDPSTGAVPCLAFVSPGQVFNVLSDNTNWTGVMKYSDTGMRKLMNYEIGAWKGVARHMSHPVHTLYNHGTLTAHAQVSSPINPGDGAKAPASGTVDGVRKVGTDDATRNYIQLAAPAGWDVDDAGDGMANFQVGDTITISIDESPGTTAPYTVQYAPMPTDGMLTYRQIVEVDAVNNRLVLDRPVQKDYTTEAAGDCDAGEYAFVSKGIHIHASLIMAGAGGVASGWADPTRVMFPPAVDDRLAQFRITWDGLGRFGLFMPEMFHVYYTSGPVSKRAYRRYGNEK